MLAAGTTCKNKGKSFGCAGRRELEAFTLSTDLPLRLPTLSAPSIEVEVTELSPQLTAFAPLPQEPEWTVSAVWTKQVEVVVEAESVVTSPDLGERGQQ